jgi:hypothetical protein
MHCANFPTSIITKIQSAFLHFDVSNIRVTLLLKTHSQDSLNTLKNTQMNKRALLLQKGSPEQEPDWTLRLNNTDQQRRRLRRVYKTQSARQKTFQREWKREMEDGKNKSSSVTITLRISCKQKTKCTRRKGETEREMKLSTHAKQRQPTVWITTHALSHSLGMPNRDKHQAPHWSPQNNEKI